MTLQPTSVEALEALVPAHPRLRVRGGGTKTALSCAAADTPTLDLSALAGIVEHTPEECTFTALAGTRIADIERVLTGHRQYLPFDPPLAAAGFSSNSIGSLNSCRPPIVDRITVNTTTGWIIGTVIRHSWRQGPAPSTAAAS
jgi:FAD/FMN-containing dehydrogenase